MKIHLLSDIHLESGHYALPADLSCDVIAAAGDIGNGLDAVEWLKTLDKPVIYILGNHEYWSTKEHPIDMADLIDQARAAAEGSNVHFLENDSTVIEGVRFLGATLWTDFGRFNPSLIAEAQRFMFDYRAIYCSSFYAETGRLAQVHALADQYASSTGDQHYVGHLQRDFIDPGLFHPFVSYLLHQESVAWINRELANQGPDRFNGETVVVTHHHPSYESLRRIGIGEEWLVPGRQFRADRLGAIDQVIKIANYASDVTIDRKAGRPGATTWMCGHLHHHLDYMQDDIRIVCNPRGRYRGPLTKQKADDLKWFGMSITDEDIAQSEALFKEQPYRGDGVDFDPQFVVEVNSGSI